MELNVMILDWLERYKGYEGNETWAGEGTMNEGTEWNGTTARVKRYSETTMKAITQYNPSNSLRFACAVWMRIEWVDLPKCNEVNEM